MTPERWSAIKEVFGRAIETDPALRQQLVDDQCAGDPALRDEILKLLQRHQEPSHLDRPIAPIAIEGGSRSLRTFEPGDVAAGRFRIVRFLGEGGMAQVYEAEDTELRSPVALKALHPYLALNEQFIERFRREIQLARQITHPNVCRVFDFGRHDRTFFFTMELIEGETLAQLLQRKGHLSVEEARPIVRQMVAGLAAAHAAGIVHRDLKSSNIMLTGDRVIVTDFGLAHIASALPGADASVTGAGFAMGTPAYMSPEQVEGGPAGAASDIYSLGVVLYETVTGRQPHQGDSPLAVVARKIRDMPRPPHELIGAIPANWESAILKCLALRPENRFSDVLEVGRALEPGGRVEARKPAARLYRWVLVALLILISVGAALILWRHQFQRQESIAVLPFADMTPEQDQAYLADGIAEELLNGLAGTPRLRVAGKASSGQFKGRTDYPLIGKQLHVASILEGSVRRQGDRTKITVRLVKAADGFQLWSRAYDMEMKDVFDVEEEVGRAVTGALKVTLLGEKSPSVATTSAEAYNAYLQGKHFREHQNNKEGLARATRYFQQATMLDPGYAQAWVGLGDCLIAQANVSYIPSEEGYRQAKEALEQALKLNPNLAAAQAAFGEFQQTHEWDWKGAEASYQRALALNPGDGGILRNMGSLARLLGRFDDSIRLYRRAIEIDPLVGYRGLALNLYYAGRLEEAKAAVEKARELSPEMVMAHYLLGRIYLAQPNPQRALDEMEREKDPLWRSFGLALTYPAVGRQKEADAALQEVVEKYGADGPYSIAQVYASRGDPDRAFEWMDRAYETRDAGLTEIKGDPLVKSLARDPRYAKMLQKMGLPL